MAMGVQVKDTALLPAILAVACFYLKQGTTLPTAALVRHADRIIREVAPMARRFARLPDAQLKSAILPDGLLKDGARMDAVNSHASRLFREVRTDEKKPWLRLFKYNAYIMRFLNHVVGAVAVAEGTYFLGVANKIRHEPGGSLFAEPMASLSITQIVVGGLLWWFWNAIYSTVLKILPRGRFMDQASQHMSELAAAGRPARPRTGTAVGARVRAHRKRA